MITNNRFTSINPITIYSKSRFLINKIKSLEYKYTLEVNRYLMVLVGKSLGSV